MDKKRVPYGSGEVKWVTTEWLEEHLEDEGLMHGTPGKLTLASCGTGREATNEYILFKYFLGYPRVKLYEGSYTEWTSYADNAAVVGMDTRQAT